MKTFIGVIALLLFSSFAEAQPVPKGMVLATDSTEASSNVENSAEDADFMPPLAPESQGVSLNWNEDNSAFADSVAIYLKDYNYNKQKAENFAKYGLISNWTGVGLATIGIGLLAVGLTGHDSGFNNVWGYTGSALFAVGA